MKVYFSDRLAYYFIKKQLADSFPVDEIQWSTFFVPPLSSGAFLDKTWTWQYTQRFRDFFESLDDEPVICFSLSDFGDLFSFVLFHRLYSDFRRTRSGSEPHLIVGGPLLYLLQMDQFLERFSELDCCVVGPGERVFGEILETLANREELPKVYKGKGRDKVKFPDIDIVNCPEIAHYTSEHYYLCSMNLDKCSWGRCKFCHHLRPDVIEPDSILEFSEKLISLNRNAGIDNFYVFDNSLTAPHTEVLLKALEKEGLAGKIRITLMGARLDKAFVDIAPLVKQLDVIVRIGWGLESFSQRILSLYSKGTKVANFEPILKAYSDIGIYNNLYVLYGLPSTRRGDIEETVSGLERIQPYYGHISSSWFLLSEGIDVFTNAESYDVIIKDRYRVCDCLGVDVLDDYNIETTFYDFDAVLDGKRMTRVEDFRRHMQFWSRIENQGVIQKFSPYLFFLRSSEDLISYAGSLYRS